MTISRMQQPRQLYGLGSLVKKITKPIKKIVKSPIGKAALGAAAIYGLGGGFGGGFQARNLPGIGRFFSRGRDLSTAFSGKAPTGILSRILGGAKTGFDGLSGTQKLFLGGGAALSALPFFMGGAEEEEEILEDPFSVTPTNISDIVAQARNRDPSLRFLPKTSVAQSGFFNAAEGGRAQLAGGGNRVTQLLQLLEGTKDPMDRRMIQQEIDMLLGKFAKGGIARLGFDNGGSIMEGIKAAYGLDLKVGTKRRKDEDLTRDEIARIKMAVFEVLDQKPDGSRSSLSGGFIDNLGDAIEQVATPDLGAYIKDYAQGTGIFDDNFIVGGKEDILKKAEGGIADLPQVRMLEGGMPEIDYRQSGGFVPVGKKEKADDVPAMLSKNEFVMTADAVRGMGDGNVEKGAQKMYDQMKQLENRTV
jgi:hypothetical protein